MNNESTKAESHLRASLLQEALWGEVPMPLAAQQRLQPPDCSEGWITVIENNTIANVKLCPDGQSAEPHLVQSSEGFIQPTLALFLQVPGVHTHALTYCTGSQLTKQICH